MAASGPEADGHLRIDMRPDRVELSLQTRALAAVTHHDTELAHHITDALGRLGRLVNDSFARSFWVLADAEGNEVCVCTWTDRDERGW